MKVILLVAATGLIVLGLALLLSEPCVWRWQRHFAKIMAELRG